MLFEIERLSQNRPLAENGRNGCPRFPIECTFGFIGQGKHKIIDGVADAAGLQNSCECPSQHREFSNHNTDIIPVFLRTITITRL